jgi:hypothetical protein
LPWSTRVTTLGKQVHVGAIKQEVFLAALPGSAGVPLAEQLSRLLGTRVIPTDSFLGMTLGNPGQLIHPGLMYGHLRTWNGEEYDEDKIPLLYAQATDEIGDIVDRLSRDARAVTRQIEVEGGLDLRQAVIPIHDWLRRVYGNVTADTSSVASCFRTGPIQARKAPTLESRPGKYVPNFAYRYLSEDVPYGLVATRALAELIGVETPMIDEVVTWGQGVLDKVYLVGGQLRGDDVAELPIPQNYGISTLPALIGWYAEHGSATLPSRPRKDSISL